MSSNWGRLGFDVGRETGGACRGCSYPRKKSCTNLIANDAKIADGELAAVAA